MTLVDPIHPIYYSSKIRAVTEGWKGKLVEQLGAANLSKQLETLFPPKDSAGLEYFI
jgi:hypothetical protein